MAEFRVKKARPIACSVTVPGDKSISHRAVMIAALSNGVCTIDGFLPSADCMATVKAFRQLGVRIEAPDLDPSAADRTQGVARVIVHGRKGELTAPVQPIDCGNSGTTMRLMSGMLAGMPFQSELFGDASLSRRPMRRVIEPLRLMGADIVPQSDNNCCPLIIHGRSLSPIKYTLPVASAQVKSAILLAGLLCIGKTTVVEPTATRDHTEKMLEYFLVKLLREPLRKEGGQAISIYGGQIPESRDFKVPGDISSAAFWLVAAAAQPGSELHIQHAGLNKTRTGLLQVLTRMGAQITEVIETTGLAEPVGHVVVRGNTLRGTVIQGQEIPNLIDELPVLAVAGALAQGKTVIKDAHELRVKETDRIAAVANNLRAMGAAVRELYDGMEIEGGTPLKAPDQPLPSFGDHRIAMAFAIAGLFADGETVIDDVECVDTSYPGFAKELQRFQSREVSQEIVTPVISHLPAPRPKSKKRPVSSAACTPDPKAVIAIDGPAASGKSSIARQLAERLHFVHVNSGAMYRAVTWAALERGIPVDDVAGITRLLESLRLECGTENGHSTFLVNGINPAGFLHQPAVNQAVSAVARVPQVRERLVALQREYAGRGPIVVEGRDIGSVVFPDSPFKYYIDASPEVRAQRRAAQGFADSIMARDSQDSTRELSPLRQAEGARVIDSSQLSIQQVVEKIVDDLRANGLAV
ncbi:MAG: 3-phosphoshikimate 1-carboxyvinyltransferase [Verrucomicrobiales bacterium]